MMVIENVFDLRQMVYLKTDAEQLVKIIKMIEVTAVELLYELSCGASTSRHYDFEISADKVPQIIY